MPIGQRLWIFYYWPSFWPGSFFSLQSLNSLGNDNKNDFFFFDYRVKCSVFLIMLHFHQTKPRKIQKGLINVMAKENKILQLTH